MYLVDGDDEFLRSLRSLHHSSRFDVCEICDKYARASRVVVCARRMTRGALSSLPLPFWSLTSAPDRNDMSSFSSPLSSHSSYANPCNER